MLGRAVQVTSWPTNRARVRRLFRIALESRHGRRHLLRGPLTTNGAFRLELHYRAVAVAFHQFSDIKVMPAVTVQTVRGEAVSGFGQIRKSFEREGLHRASIARPVADLLFRFYDLVFYRQGCRCIDVDRMPRDNQLPIFG